MTGKAKRLTGWAAAFVLTLQAILGGFDSRPVMAGFDPAAIICHGDASSGAGGPGTPATADDCCDHCVLCKAMPATDAPAPVDVSTWLSTRLAGLHPGSTINATAIRPPASNLPRAPPVGA